MATIWICQPSHTELGREESLFKTSLPYFSMDLFKKMGLTSLSQDIGTQ